MDWCRALFEVRSSLASAEHWLQPRAVGLTRRVSGAFWSVT